MLQPVEQNQLERFPSLKLQKVEDLYKEGHRLGLNYFNFYTNHVTTHLSEIPLDDLAKTVEQCLGIQAQTVGFKEDSLEYAELIKGCNDVCQSMVQHLKKRTSKSNWF